MSGEGTNERGPKPPRTMFSLGRPGASKGTSSAPPEATDDPGLDPGLEEPTEAYAEEETLDADELEYEYLCGSCAEPLPNGATECPACGTPVALADEEYLGDYDDRLGDEDDVALVDDGEDDDLGDEDEGDRFAAAGVAGVGGVAAGLAAHELAEEPVAADDLAEEPASFDEGGADVPADAGAGGAEVGAPAAVLYHDPSVTEPLPPEPSGEWGIAAPVMGSAADELLEEPGELAEEPAALAEEPGELAEEPGGLEEEPAAFAEEPEPVTADDDAAHDLAGAGLVGAGVGAAVALGDHGAEAATMEQAAYQPPEAVPTAANLPYGTGPVTSSEPAAKSKAPIVIGAVAAVVIIGVILGLVLAGGGDKKENVQTAQPASTTTTAVKGGGEDDGGKGSSTTAKSTTTTAGDDGSTTTTTESTSSTATTASTTATTTAVTVNTPPPTQIVTIATPPPTQATTTTLSPGRISASPPSGGSVSVAKGGSFTITLTNTGGRPAQCNLSAGSGLSLANNCAPTIAPGGTVTVTVVAGGVFEGNTAVTGLVEGIGSYNLSVFVKNG